MTLSKRKKLLAATIDLCSGARSWLCRSIARAGALVRGRRAQHGTETNVRGAVVDFLRLARRGPVARAEIRRTQPRSAFDDAQRPADRRHHLGRAGRIFAV